MALSLAISQIFSIKEWPDLEIWVLGRSRWFKMSRFDRSCTTFCWSAIVIWRWIHTCIHILFAINEWYYDLDIWVRGHSRSFKPVPFDSLGAVSYSPSIVTMALSCISSEMKPDIGRNSCFFHTLAFGAPAKGVPVRIFYPVWYGKTRMVGLPDG